MRPAAIIFALAMASRAFAQQQTPTFTSTVTLVAVDVTALDKDGKPVPGLTADDFHIKLNGKAAPVQTITYVDVAPAPGDAPSRAAAEVTGRRVMSNTTPPATQRVFIVTVDDLSFPRRAGIAS